ncbi:MAG: hypothetical protein A2096_08960 [Spirochaetes bacterium GWF1_41_5]|nr:MAG: hypothetical protein A2096_08960 [Spirochaetes bacterium GWF1_41_5]HBE01089.1 hypothetical protein [Spirochaetia bacterium]
MIFFLRFLFFIFYPVLFSGMLIMAGLKKMAWREFLERAGIRLPGGQVKTGLWVHLSSAGEFFTARKLLNLLSRENNKILLTYFYKDMPENAAASGLCAAHFFLPIENFISFRIIIKRLGIKKLIIFETEIWPLLISEAAALGVQVILANGYIYNHDYPVYNKFSFFFRPVIRSYAALLVQTESERSKYISLGARPDLVFVTGDLKFDMEYVPGSDQTCRKLFFLPETGKIFICASVHKGEESAVCAAALKLSAAGIFTVIAPRFHRDFPVFAGELDKKNIIFRRRSQELGAGGGEKTASVLLLDTVGELSKLLPSAELVFVGGSLVPRGGHNLFEPVLHNCRTCTGPYYFNFQAMAGMLLEKGYLDIVQKENFYNDISSLFLEKRADNGAEFARSLAGACRKTAEILGSLNNS